MRPSGEIEELVDELNRRLPLGQQLLDAIRPALDERDVEPLIEYLAERLHQAEGEGQMTFELSDGNLRRTRLGRGPIGNDELEQIAKVA